MSNKTTLFNASPSNFNILLIRISVFILSAFSFSQGSSKIKGSVVDIQTNNGLAGANVFIGALQLEMHLMWMENS